MASDVQSIGKRKYNIMFVHLSLSGFKMTIYFLMQNLPIELFFNRKSQIEKTHSVSVVVKMFAAEKIYAIFNATLLLGYYPEFNSFIFNENVQDFQNVHGKYWQLREYNLTTIKSDNKLFVAGVSVLYKKK